MRGVCVRGLYKMGQHSLFCVSLITFVFCFGDDPHRRDARHSHPCEDRRDAETAHQVCKH